MELKFLHFNLKCKRDVEESEAAHAADPRVEVVEECNPVCKEAIDTVELYWKMMAQLYAQLQQHNSLTMFLSACAKADRTRFVKLITAQFGQVDQEQADEIERALMLNVRS